MGVVTKEFHRRVSLLKPNHEEIVCTCSAALVEFVEFLGANVGSYDLLAYSIILRLVKAETYQEVYLLTKRTRRATKT